jgi:hypothetical protein
MMKVTWRNSWIPALLNANIINIRSNFLKYLDGASMSKSFYILSLSLFLLSHGLPVFADQYDDCIKGCNENLAPCIDQARLKAGNVQEEQDLIAACNKSKSECKKACSDAEAQSQQPQPLLDEQPQSP